MKHPFNRETLAFIRSVGIKKPVLWIHGYFFVSYLDLYLKTLMDLIRRLPKIPKFLKDFASHSYRGKVTTLEDAKKLMRINLEIPIDNLERILTLKEATSIVYRTGDKILVTECPCRKLVKNPCKPSEVCMAMGEPFTSLFARQIGPGNYRWISPEEAIDILEMTEKLGWIHLTFNRDVAGDNFYAICNCCKCCCSTHVMREKAGVSVIHHSGYLAEVNGSCIGCGTCESICQFGAICLGEEGTAVIDLSKCQGCGICASNCQESAIVLKEVETGLKPLRLPA